MKAYYDYKILLTEEMLQARKNIHLSFDLCTSDNFITFVAIVAHYINNNDQLQTILIGLCQVIDFHFRAVIAKQVVDLIHEYGIEKKLRYFIFDNATSNDICIKAIFKAIQPGLFRKKQTL